jgi:hypothetical protein
MNDLLLDVCPEVLQGLAPGNDIERRLRGILKQGSLLESSDQIHHKRTGMPSDLRYFFNSRIGISR